MDTKTWLDFLNGLSEEELEQVFVGMAVRLLTKGGKIVRVINNAL